MFNFVESAGDNAGYQIRITYNPETKKYLISGYIMFKDRSGYLEHDRDGAPIVFDTIEAALTWIINYPDVQQRRDPKQLELNFEKEM